MLSSFDFINFTVSYKCSYGNTKHENKLFQVKKQVTLENFWKKKIAQIVQTNITVCYTVAFSQHNLVQI